MSNKTNFILFGVIFFLLFSIFYFFYFDKRDYVIINGDKIRVEIADSDEERIMGLMHRDSLGARSGMLFIFDDSGVLKFWMKNTLIPLDIIFIDEDFKIVKIWRNVQPCLSDPCEIYSSNADAKYVLEINGNASEEFNIKEGDFIKIL